MIGYLARFLAGYAIVAVAHVAGADPWAVVASIGGVVFANLPDPDTKERR